MGDALHAVQKTSPVGIALIKRRHNPTYAAKMGGDFGADLLIPETAVRQSVKVPLKQGQFDALVLLILDIGAAAFRESVMLGLINQEDWTTAAGEFGRWAYVGLEATADWVERRDAERKMFLGE